VRECEGMNPQMSSHFGSWSPDGMNSHFGSWNPDGLSNFQKEVIGVKTHWIE